MLKAYINCLYPFIISKRNVPLTVYFIDNMFMLAMFFYCYIYLFIVHTSHYSNRFDWSVLYDK